MDFKCSSSRFSRKFKFGDELIKFQKNADFFLAMNPMYVDRPEFKKTFKSFSNQFQFVPDFQIPLVNYYDDRKI